MSSEPSWLRSRWDGAGGRPLADEVLKRLAAVRSLGLHDLSRITKTPTGHLDLRGFPLGPDLFLQDCTLQHIDLSYSKAHYLRLEGCILERVLFDRGDCRHWSDRRCTLRGVSFRGASLRDAAIGLDGSTFNDTDFSDADFTGASFYRPIFTGCDFSGATLREINFNASSFIDCKFKGRLESVWFGNGYRFPADVRRFGRPQPNRMDGVDFSQAELWDVVYFGGLDLSKVRLPVDGYHVLIEDFGNTLQRAKARLSEGPPSLVSVRKLVSVIDSFLVHAKDQPMWILNKREMVEELGDDVGNEFLRLIAQPTT